MRTLKFKQVDVINILNVLDSDFTVMEHFVLLRDCVKFDCLSDIEFTFARAARNFKPISLLHTTLWDAHVYYTYSTLNMSDDADRIVKLFELIDSHWDSMNVVCTAFTEETHKLLHSNIAAYLDRAFEICSELEAANLKFELGETLALVHKDLHDYVTNERANKISDKITE